MFSRGLIPLSTYWFGFISADGSIGHYGRQHSFSFGLKGEDINCVRQLAEDLGYEKERVKINKSNGCAVFQVNCKQLVLDLENLGLMQRKSRKIDGSIIPLTYASHFIRGLFDGDGSVGLYSRGPDRNTLARSFMLYGNKPLLEAVGDRVGHLGRFSMWTRPSTGVSQVGTGSRDTIKKLHDYLYHDADRYLIRKKKRFDTVINYRGWVPTGPRNGAGRKLMMVECNLCGKSVWQRKDCAKRPGNHFCSRKCGVAFARQVKARRSAGNEYCG